MPRHVILAAKQLINGEGARAVSENIVSIDEESPHKDIKNLARKTVEEMLDAPLDGPPECRTYNHL